MADASRIGAAKGEGIKDTARECVRYERGCQERESTTKLLCCQKELFSHEILTHEHLHSVRIPSNMLGGIDIPSITGRVVADPLFEE